MVGLALALHALDLALSNRLSAPSMATWTTGRRGRHTRNRLGVAATLSPGDKDDVVLARVDIVVLENEELVDTVLLESGDLDDAADGADEAAVQDEVLLASHLFRFKHQEGGWGGPGSCRRLIATYALEQVEKVFARLAPDLVRAELGARRHGSSPRPSGRALRRGESSAKLHGAEARSKQQGGCVGGWSRRRLSTHKEPVLSPRGINPMGKGAKAMQGDVQVAGANGGSSEYSPWALNQPGVPVPAYQRGVEDPRNAPPPFEPTNAEKVAATKMQACQRVPIRRRPREKHTTIRAPLQIVGSGYLWAPTRNTRHLQHAAHCAARDAKRRHPTAHLGNVGRCCPSALGLGSLQPWNKSSPQPCIPQGGRSHRQPRTGRKIEKKSAIKSAINVCHIVCC